MPKNPQFYPQSRKIRMIRHNPNERVSRTIFFLIRSSILFILQFLPTKLCQITQLWRCWINTRYAFINLLLMVYLFCRGVVVVVVPFFPLCLCCGRRLCVDYCIFCCSLLFLLSKIISIFSIFSWLDNVCLVDNIMISNLFAQKINHLIC